MRSLKIGQLEAVLEDNAVWVCEDDEGMEKILNMMTPTILGERGPEDGDPLNFVLYEVARRLDIPESDITATTPPTVFVDDNIVH